MADLPVIDDAERALIREALKRYKEHNGGIGDPELLQRMLYTLYGDRASVHESSLTLSTLQRYFKGKVRTDDRVVLRYRQFLERVAPPEGAEEFAKELFQYFAPALAIAEPAKLDEFARIYHVHGKGFPRPGRRNPVREVRYKDGSEFTSGTLMYLEPNLKSGSFKVEEKFIVDQNPGLGIKPEIVPHTSGGAFIPLGTMSVLIFIRTYLNARLYVLERDTADSGVLVGSLFQIDTVPAAALVRSEPGYPSSEVRLVPVQAEDEIFTST